jgi:glycosyltransferase involved in cell wall biosynthesis
MAVALAELARQLAASDVEVRTLRTTPGSVSIGATYHARRAITVLTACVRLTWLRRRYKTAILSVDAGYGGVYTVFLAATARLLGFRVILQHHSYAYINQPSRLIRVLVAASGAPALHLLSCECMRKSFADIYRRARRTEAVSIGYVLDYPANAESRGRTPSDQPRPEAANALRLGMLSNLTLDKGLDLTIETAVALRQAGIDTVLKLAGPASEPSAQQAIDEAIQRDPELVSYVGPVYGPDKVAFFESIDVFLFPSRYANESFGIVVWEALLAGVPVITYEAGCLTDDAVGDGGLVLPTNDAFVDRAVDRVRSWSTNPAQLAASSSAGRQAALRMRGDGLQDVQRLTAHIREDVAGKRRS